MTKMRKQSAEFPGFRFLMPNGKDAVVGDIVEMSRCCADAQSKRGWVKADQWVDPAAAPKTMSVPIDRAHDADKPKTRRLHEAPAKKER